MAVTISLLMFRTYRKMLWFSYLGRPLGGNPVSQGPSALQLVHGRLSDVAHLPHFSVYHVTQGYLYVVVRLEWVVRPFVVDYRTWKMTGAMVHEVGGQARTLPLTVFWKGAEWLFPTRVRRSRTTRRR